MREPLELRLFVRIADALIFDRHAVADRAKAFARDVVRAFVHAGVERFSRDERIHECAVEGSRGALECLKRDCLVGFGLFQPDGARLGNLKPCGQLGGGHAQRFADRPDPAARRAREGIRIVAGATRRERRGMER